MAKKKKNYNPNGRCSPDSSIAHENKLQKERYGELENEGEMWTNEQLNSLMKLFLIDEIPWKGKNSMCTELGRTYKSVETQLQKMAFCYGDKEASYRPVYCYTREGKPFSRREVWIIKLAVGENWRLRGAYRVEYLSRVLLRPMWELNDFLDELAHEWGLGIDKPRFDKETERAIRIEKKLCKWRSDWKKGGRFDLRVVGGRPRKKSPV